MKIIKRRHTWLTVIASIALIGAAGGGTWLWLRRSPAMPEPQSAQHGAAITPQQPAPHPKPQPTPTPAPKPTPKPMPHTIQLPGATPITARRADYRADSDIWKLVNKSVGFTQPTYVPADLQLVTVSTKPGRGRDERSLRAVLMPSLQAMVRQAADSGAPLHVGSGYRSYHTQAVLFASYSRQYGAAAAARFSSRPGHSEHQSGLSVDFDTPDGRCWVEECFEHTPQGKWLAANAHRYGFILRYPKGKEAITGYIYEPWHFRYVGRELATALFESQLTFEQAAPYLQRAQQAGDDA